MNTVTEDLQAIRMARIDKVLALVRIELQRAIAKHGVFQSPHEAWAVIYEELDELWDEVKANRGRSESALSEAIQTAAMGVRYVADMAQEIPPYESIPSTP
jgi:hypothetical protein